MSIEAQQRHTITLNFRRDDGGREVTHLHHYSLAQARSFVDSVFYLNERQYMDVEISTNRGYRETLFNLYATAPEDLQRI
jgi:hypothetical protein